jgi:hypothetical protein
MEREKRFIGDLIFVRVICNAEANRQLTYLLSVAEECGRAAVAENHQRRSKTSGLSVKLLAKAKRDL